MGEAAAGAVEEGCVGSALEGGPNQMVRALLCLEQRKTAGEVSGRAITSILLQIEWLRSQRLILSFLPQAAPLGVVARSVGVKLVTAEHEQH